jgi:chemotaxis protein CheZ
MTRENAAGKCATEAAAGGAAADPRLGEARALLAHLETGDEAAAATALDALTRLRESDLFQEIGKLTRELHDTLNAFRLDSRVASLANVDIPDAKDRLRYVVRMTEQAATATLNRIEESRPICRLQRERSAVLGAAWGRFLGREMGVEEFRGLVAEVGEFIAWTERNAATLDAGLSEVLMAQSYQDLTGQIIKRVIALVEEVEGNLVNLIRLSGQRLAPQPQTGGNRLEGPQVPGREGPDAVANQDEVDDLLSRLGF